MYIGSKVKENQCLSRARPQPAEYTMNRSIRMEKSGKDPGTRTTVVNMANISRDVSYNIGDGVMENPHLWQILNACIVFAAYVSDCV